MRVTSIILIVGEPDIDAATECPDCGFDAVLRWPLTSLSLNGVGPAGHYIACTRCYEESR